METIKEGLAEIIVNDGTFYNAKMKRLRDMSVIFLKSLGLGSASVLDSTAATGIRGIRYLLEALHGKAVLLDINPKAYANAQENIARNRLGSVAEAINASVQEFANGTAEKFDVIDLDPFGTPAPYVYDLLKLAKDNAVFMITATDTATLCGAEGDACLRIYAARPARNELCHEASLRILLAYVARIAAQFNFGIVPLFGIAELHYVRIFIRLEKGASKAVASVKSIGAASSCNKCHAFYYSLSPECAASVCANCGSRTEQFGPLWLGKLYDKAAVARMLDIAEDPGIRATLQGAFDGLDTPFFYSLDKITEHMRMGSVQRSKVVELLKQQHAEASATSFGRNAIKTNAGIKEIEKAVRLASAGSK
ncbi:MAG: hypothetical protein ACP5T3_03035 [Candidatus Micrarchaeia archaeon]